MERAVRNQADAEATQRRDQLQLDGPDREVVEALLRHQPKEVSARRCGLGRTLLRRMLADAARVGAEQCFLEVRESNLAAIALYLREGFAPVARRVAYYPPLAGASRREDALVMRRPILLGSDDAPF